MTGRVGAAQAAAARRSWRAGMQRARSDSVRARAGEAGVAWVAVANSARGRGGHGDARARERRGSERASCHGRFGNIAGQETGRASTTATLGGFGRRLPSILCPVQHRKGMEEHDRGGPTCKLQIWVKFVQIFVNLQLQENFKTKQKFKLLLFGTLKHFFHT